MLDLANIIDGWKNFLFSRDPEILRVAKERMEICVKCEHAKPAGTFGGLKIPYHHCDICGCQLDAKVSNMRPDRLGCPDKPKRWV